MRTALPLVAAALAACAANAHGSDAADRLARLCVRNEGFALVTVRFTQRDVIPVTFRGVAPGETECRRVMLGYAAATIAIESDDQPGETFPVGPVRPGNSLIVTVPRSIAHTSVMEYAGGR